MNLLKANFLVIAQGMREPVSYNDVDTLYKAALNMTVQNRSFDVISANRPVLKAEPGIRGGYFVSMGAVELVGERLGQASTHYLRPSMEQGIRFHWAAAGPMMTPRMFDEQYAGFYKRSDLGAITVPLRVPEHLRDVATNFEGREYPKFPLPKAFGG